MLYYLQELQRFTGIRYDRIIRKNLQGDIIGIINAVGMELVSYSSDAWGNILWTEDDSGRNLAELNPYRYRGYYYDTETGLYYLNSRYYDPKVGRFLNADAIDYLRMNGQFNCNLYIYCANNPVKRKDAAGCFWREIGSFFKNVGEQVIDFVKNIFGAEAYFDYQRTDIDGIISYGIFSVTTGVREKASLGGRDDSKFLFLYARGRSDNWLMSSVGLKVNLGRYSAVLNVGLDDIGISCTVKEGDAIYKTALTLNLSELKIGFENSMSMSYGNMTQETYTNISLEGKNILMFLVLLLAGKNASEAFSQPALQSAY